MAEHLKILTTIPAMTSDSAYGVKKILDTTIESLFALNSLGRNVDGWDDLIVLLTVEKLSPQTRLM